MKEKFEWNKNSQQFDVRGQQHKPQQNIEPRPQIALIPKFLITHLGSRPHIKFGPRPPFVEKC